jgi:hypothetical protein
MFGCVKYLAVGLEVAIRRWVGCCSSSGASSLASVRGRRRGSVTRIGGRRRINVDDVGNVSEVVVLRQSSP